MVPVASWYGTLEQLTIEVFPIKNESEKDDFFKDKQVKRFRKRIDAWENCYSSQDKLALIPLVILGKAYVAKMTNENENAIIESIDGQVINMLLAVYTLSVRVNIDNEGGGRDV